RLAGGAGRRRGRVDAPVRRSDLAVSLGAGTGRGAGTMSDESQQLRVALTSKGDYEQSTARFLDGAGLSVWRPNPRQYVGRIAAIPDARVLFQRTEDIVHKVADGSADLGITGYD